MSGPTKLSQPAETTQAIAADRWASVASSRSSDAVTAGYGGRGVTPGQAPGAGEAERCWVGSLHCGGC